MLGTTPRSGALKRYGRDESGATAIEYGLLAAMIAAVLVAMLETSGAVDEMYAGLLVIADAIRDAIGGGGGGS